MELSFEQANFSHWEEIRDMRNHEELKPGFINQDHIDKITHTKYMCEHWEEYFICLEKGEPIGYYGVVDGDIRFCVHPAHQKKGFGTQILIEIRSRHPHASAIVKEQNEASIKSFEAAGYTKKHTFIYFENDGN